jgi:Ca-activated chloride channel family protein
VIFVHPYYLFLLFVLPLLAWLKGGKGKPPAFLYSSVQLVRPVLNITRSRAGGFLGALRWVALALFIIALARPQLTKSETKVTASGVDIVVAFDLSYSMVSEDFESHGERISRIDLAKSVLSQFIAKRPNDRIGLIVFAAQAFIVSPPTLDHDFLLRQLEQLHAGRIDGSSTAIGSAMASAMNRLRDLKSKSKIVVLMTDGQNNAGKVAPLTVAEAAQALGVKIYTIGIGTHGKAPMPYIDRNGNYILDPFGRKRYQMEDVDVDEETLQKIAAMTNGKYYRADNIETFKAIYPDIDKLEKSEMEIKKFTQRQDLFSWFISPGLGLLLVEILLRHTLLRRLP